MHNKNEAKEMDWIHTYRRFTAKKMEGMKIRGIPRQMMPQGFGN